MVGWASTSDNTSEHAFRTAPNSPINPGTDDVGTLGGANSEAYGINNSGQVVGTSDRVAPPYAITLSAFRTAPNSPINPATDDLVDYTPCYPYSPDYPWQCIWGAGAYDINDSGQVVGFMEVTGSDTRVFRTAPNSRISVWDDDFYGCFSCWAYAINASGQTVGSIYGYNGTYGGVRAFRAGAIPSFPNYDDLGTLTPGGLGSEERDTASDINAFGQVVGASNGQAFRTAPNSPINPTTDGLGSLGGTSSEARSIDNYGQVVGWATMSDATQHAFLYSGGVMHDVSTLLPPDTGCDLVVSPYTYIPFRGVDINDAGQIAATGNCNGQRHAVRLDPIYKAFVQQPINADGSSVFSAKRGVVPVKFAVTQYGTQASCTLPATIGIVKAGNGTLASVDESSYSMQADSGSNFRIDATACQYVYNLSASALGGGTYRVDISINGIMVGHAVFALQ